MKLGNEVGYSIRFEDCTTDRTIIKCDRSPPSCRVLAAYAGSSATCRSMRTADGTISECLALAQSPGRRRSRSRSRSRLSRAKAVRGRRAVARGPWPARHWAVGSFAAACRSAPFRDRSIGGAQLERSEGAVPAWCSPTRAMLYASRAEHSTLLGT